MMTQDQKDKMVHWLSSKDNEMLELGMMLFKESEPTMLDWAVIMRRCTLTQKQKDDITRMMWEGDMAFGVKKYDWGNK